MNDPQRDAVETVEEDSANQPDIGAKALALAGFTEMALRDDPTPHGGVLTWIIWAAR